MTAATVRQRVERHVTAATANFWCHVVEGAFASFAFELAGPVVFSVLAAALGASPSLLGLLMTLGSLTFITPLLFARRVEATRCKKRLVLLLGLGQRLPFLTTPLLLLFVAPRAPLVCLAAIAVMRLVSGMIVSLLVPPWMDLLAETVPRERMGRLVGFRQSLSAGLGLIAGPISALILATLAFPHNYASLYGIAFVSVMISWLLFTLVDEMPHRVAPAPNNSQTHYFRDLFRALRADHNYCAFLLYQAVSRLGFAAIPFYALVAVQVYGVSAAYAAGTFITAGCVARIFGSLVIPLVAERIGYKRTLGIGAGLHVAALLLAACAPSGAWYAIVFFLANLGMAAKSVAGMPFTMSVAPRGRRIGYAALSNTALAPIGMMAPALAGVGLDRFGHGMLFALGAAFVIAALLPLERCHMPVEATTASEMKV